MAQVTLTEREFARGPQRWRVDSKGRWSVLTFGWFPGHTDSPSYRWQVVERERVPAELLEAAR